MAFDNTQEKRGFEPARLRDLSLKGHVLYLFCTLVIAVVGFSYFGPLHDNDAADSDDHICLRDAERRDTMGEIFDPWLTTGNESLDSSYLPIQGLVYHLSVNVMEERLIGARIIGIWLHVINGCLIMLLAFRFCRSIPIAHLASLFFLFHPRVVGAESWLSASVAHGIVLFFYLSAFIVLQTFLHRRSWWRLPIGVFLFMCAVLTKELAATLAAAVFLYDVLVVTGLRALWRPKLKVWGMLALRHLAMFGVVIAAVIIQRTKYDSGFIANSWGGVEIGLRCPMRLLELLMLTFYWDGGWDRHDMLWAMGAIAAVLFAAAYLTRRRGELLFFVLWIPLVMTPYTISNFRNAGSLGRYTYEVLAVMSIFGAMLIGHLVKRLPWMRWPLLVAVGALLVSFFSNADRILN